MEYVVFRSGGKQYVGKVGDTLIVDKVSGEVNSDLSLSEVLLWVSEGQSKIGKPTIEGAKVKTKILEHAKGDKIRVAKFKAKARYRKVIGFRPHLTVLRIEKLEIPKASAGKSESTLSKKMSKKIKI